MPGKQRLFRLFGIDVNLHYSFFILPVIFWFIYSRQGGAETGLRAVALVGLVFFCVIGHEFSHSLVARAFSIETSRITLYPIGGIASMGRIPEKPHQEFLITLAGPLFNFVLAAILFFPLLNWLGPENFYSPSLSSWPKTIANLFWINPMLGLFNLIPAFPMDGGRILRAILANWFSYRTATQISARLGQLFAIIFFFYGIWTKNAMLVFIAFFVFTSASEEISRRGLNPL